MDLSGLWWLVAALYAILTGGSASAELGVNGAGIYFVKAFSTPTVAGTVVGRVAGAVLSKAVTIKAALRFFNLWNRAAFVLVDNKPSPGDVFRGLVGILSITGVKLTILVSTGSFPC
jgi:hypothetical protein